MKFLIVCFIAITLSGCAESISISIIDAIQPVGFWYGLWHGIIFPFAWLVSLFNESTAIYAIYNNGGWYDFGFFLGVGGFSASIISFN